jgi:hypothetical protein
VLKRSVWFILLLGLTVASLLSGCGGGGDGSDIPDPDSSWKQVGSNGFNASQVSYMAMVCYQQEPYVACSDGTGSVLVSRFNRLAGEWEPFGTGFQAETAGVAIAVSNGIPFVAYSDNNNSGKLTVKSWNNTDWVNVGTPGFSDGSADYLCIACDNTGSPYVAYKNGQNTVSNTNRAIVKKFNGSSWENVGGSAVSANTADYISFVVDNNIPYIAFQDVTDELAIVVKRLDGSVWTDLGDAGSGSGNYLSLAVNNGAPYLAYLESTNSGYGGRLKRYNSGNWQDTGSFSTGTVTDISLALDGSVPYVAYRDATSERAVVRRYSGTSWQNVGDPVSTGLAEYINLSISSGVPYAAFVDDGIGKVMNYAP